MQVPAGATNVRPDVRVVNRVGETVLGLVAADFSTWYSRNGVETPISLAEDDVKEIGDGWYSVLIPDAAFEAGVYSVLVGGIASGGIVLSAPIEIQSPTPDLGIALPWTFIAVDNVTGVRIAQAVVRVTRGSLSTTLQTVSDGTARFSLDAGTYEVSYVKEPEYSGAVQTVAVPGSQTRAPYVTWLRLTRRSPTPQIPIVAPVDVVVPGIPRVEGCPVYSRGNVFVMQQGRAPTLRYTFRHVDGSPILWSDIAPGVPQGPVDCVCEAKIREAVSPESFSNPVITVSGVFSDDTSLIGDFKLATKNTIRSPGIYDIFLGVRPTPSDGDLDPDWLLIQQGLLWVEPSLFRANSRLASTEAGPPTVHDIRRMLMDMGREENLAFDDFEFGTDQLADCLTRPVNDWRDSPPDMRDGYDTRNFPFREPWIHATIAHLLFVLGTNYMRNDRPDAGGGLNTYDANRYEKYMKVSQQLEAEWIAFRQAKKFQANTAAMWGTIG